MRWFKHVDASTLQEAAGLLAGGGARLLAGGTVVLGELKNDLFADYPQAIVNIKSIPDLDYIREENGTLTIGALTRIADIAGSDLVKEKCGILAEAAGKVASPQIREMGTLGGNLCQGPRCWYYWSAGNRFHCLRKGGAACWALTGENQHSSIFGSLAVGDPACRSSCPAGCDTPLYMSKLRAGDLAGAARILLQYNPLPAITGRVCQRFCEEHCARGEFDEPVSINAVERFLGDWVLENADEIIEPVAKVSGKRVAVVGSGPAGLAAAYYLRTFGHDVDVFERMAEAGGVLRYGIPPYRLPKEVVRKQIALLERMGIHFNLNVEIGKHISLDQLTGTYDSVFLGCGTWVQGRIGIEGEELLDSALGFLTRVNAGDRKLPAREVLVIGGGNVAVDAAVTARRLGAARVTMACLEKREDMPAAAREIEEAEAEGIRIMPSFGPGRVLAAGGKLAGLELVRCLAVFDGAGRFAPVFDQSIRETVRAGLVILATGQKSDISLAGLETRRGLVVVDEGRTSRPGVFAGGDVTTGSRSVIEAVAAGRAAARSIGEHLPAPDQERGLMRFNTAYLEEVDRASVPRATQRCIDGEDVTGLGRAQVLREAGRCFNCGCVAVNVSDLAPALIVLRARVKTTQRVLAAGDFFQADLQRSTVLAGDEIVTEVQVPLPDPGTAGAFIKFALRQSIDFPMVNCAVALETFDGTVRSARICFNAVFGTPLRAGRAEEMITGRRVHELDLDEVAGAGVHDVLPLAKNSYKVQIAKALLKKALIVCCSSLTGLPDHQ